MAGAGYKLFTTGSVLTAADVNTYLAEQTVMVFANAAARTTALSGVVSEGMISYLKDTNAVEVYDGSNWVSSDDPNAIQNSIINAKGDLIVGSANDTPSILSVSSDGSTLVADSSQTTGLRYNPPVGSLANPVINGGMDIAQRGTSIAQSAGFMYGLDRWMTVRNAFATGATISRQSVSDSTNLPNIQFSQRLQRNSGNTSTDQITTRQAFETANSIPFAGKTITLSFYARRGANYSATNNNFTSIICVGTGTDQAADSIFAWTGNVQYTQTQQITTTWTRYVQTVSIPSTTTQMGLYFEWYPTGTAGANDWAEITGVQIDVGTWTASTAPTFRRSGGTLAGELAACQRYYYRSTGSSYEYFCSSANSQTTAALGSVFFPVTMRTAPSFSASAGNTFMVYHGTTITAGTAMTSDGTQRNVGGVVLSVASGLTVGQASNIRANNTTAFLEFSSEL